MAIPFEIGLDTEAFEAEIERSASAIDREMDAAMALAQEVVVTEAQIRVPDKTGILKQSIQALPPTGSFASNTLEGVVAAGAPHALPVEDGTRPHVIRPRFRRALRFPMAGGKDGFGYAKKVNHPGTEPRPFLEPALDAKADEVTEIFGDAIELALDKTRGR